MVEQQVVALEVGGSNPPIYPIDYFVYDFVSVTEKKKLNNLCFLVKIFKYINNTNLFLYTGDFFILKNLHLITSFWKNLTEFCNKPSKSVFFKKNSKIINPKVLVSYRASKNTFKLFKVFLTSSSSKPNTSLAKSYIIKFNYIYPSSSTSFISLQRLFTIWKNYYTLMYNIFYYKVNIITFVNSFFIREVAALNWFMNKQLKNIWRYIQPFFFFKSGQIFNLSNFFFTQLRENNVNTSLVLDVFSNKKNLYYLSRYNFFTIGLVTANSYSKYIDFYVITTNDSIYTQLFFVRYLLSIKKVSENQLFFLQKNYWSNLLSFYNC